MRLLILGLFIGPVLSTDFTQTVFGRSDVDGVPAAFGDFNSDELTDIFMLRDNFKTIQVKLDFHNLLDHISIPLLVLTAIITLLSTLLPK